MRIATWNIDGLKTRRDELLRWLRENQPDIMALQETKTDDDAFRERYEPGFEAGGYGAAFQGQRSQCGVAILCRQPLAVTQKGLPGQEDLGARLLTVRTAGLSFTTVYVPIASSKGQSGVDRKLERLDALSEYLREPAHKDMAALLCGDFNITPAPMDGWRHWHEQREDKSKPGFRDDERSRIHSLQGAGWFDLVCHANPAQEMFTWWHSWSLYAEHKGLRLDLAFGNRAVLDRLQSARTDRTPLERRRGNKRPDHAPVIVDLN